MSRFGAELIESLTDALAHARGETSGVREDTLDVPDVRAIRRVPRLSQQNVAASYHIPLTTLKSSGPGRRHPDAPAAAYLLPIARRPREISDALNA